jgi:hypothetical protein
MKARPRDVGVALPPEAEYGEALELLTALGPRAFVALDERRK